MSTIQDTDILLVNRGGTDYKVTAVDLYEYINPKPPWEGADGIYHVIWDSTARASFISIGGHTAIYDKDTWAKLTRIPGPGEYIITGVNTKFNDSTGNWQFGPLTDTSKVTDMSRMFYYAKEFNSDLTMFDTSNVTNMAYMFYEAKKFTSDVSNWDVSNVKNMDNMFQRAYQLRSDVSNWDVGNVTSMHHMFEYCSNFNSDISNWDVSNVENMDNMMPGTQLNHDLRGWCVSKITSRPVAFSDGSTKVLDPCWGHCPRGENGTVDPCPGPSFVIASVGTAGADWSQYVSLVEYPNGNDIPDSEFFYWPKENRDPARIFTVDDLGNPLGFDAACNTENILIFAPAGGIRVYESITIRAGFNDHVYWGIMEINKGEISQELAAPNLDPQEFTIPYDGILNEFSIRQRDEYYEPSFGMYSWAPSIKYIDIDGKHLLNQLATTLTFTDDEFFDRLKVGTQLMQVSPAITGVVSAIDPDNLKVVLDDEYPEWVTGSSVIIVGEKV